MPNGLILPPLIRTLLAAGMDARYITVLVATGLHRPNLGAELRELVGDDWVLQTVRVENHEAEDDAAHVEVGTTSRGTGVRLDRRFVEADLKIATGLVEPHFMAGYSGGRKVIAPGVAHADTIRTFHHARYMEDPLARNCQLDGNPLHADQLENPGDARRGVRRQHLPRRGAAADLRQLRRGGGQPRAGGGVHAALGRGAGGRHFRCVITSGAGYPLDQSYYQTVKGIVGALGILEKGGSLLIASECAEGLGSAGFHRSQATLVEHGIEGFLAEARRGSSPPSTSGPRSS